MARASACHAEGRQFESDNPLHLISKKFGKSKEALARPKDEFIRDSVIQRFEFCIELAWKTSKKTMGSSSTAPKEVIREMAQNLYIADISLWLKAIDERNLSSHTPNPHITASN